MKENEMILELDIGDNDLYGGPNNLGSNVLILPSNKEERKKLHKDRLNNENKRSRIKERRVKVSKRKLRKLKQLEERKRRKLEQSDITKELEIYSLNEEEMLLMRDICTSTGSNNRVRKILAKRFIDAGLEVPEDLKIKKLKIKNRDKVEFCEKDKCLNISKSNFNKKDLEVPKQYLSVRTYNNNKLVREDNILHDDIPKLNINNENKEESDKKDDIKTYVRKVYSIVPSEGPNRPNIVRSPEIEAIRNNLPVRMFESDILEGLEKSDIIIVTGSTGSGKSTQVPQLLYESGYCSMKEDKLKRYKIGLTQPRRIAAISLSKRIGEELGDNNFVGYQVRYDKGNCPKDASIKVMTDGILLQEVQKDLKCSEYSVIIVDEAHERTVNTDILIGLLSRVVKLRRDLFSNSSNLLPPLKLIIMSATLRITDFTENKKLFPIIPPIISIETPNFPVTIHYCKKTPSDYMKAVYKKIIQIHEKLPPGSILVFVTGKREVKQLTTMINKEKHKILKDKIDCDNRTLFDEEYDESNDENSDNENIDNENIDNENIDNENSDNENNDDENSVDEIKNESNNEKEILRDTEIKENSNENHCIPIQSKDLDLLLDKDTAKYNEYTNDIHLDEKKNLEDQEDEVTNIVIMDNKEDKIVYGSSWEAFNKEDTRKRKIRLHQTVDSSVWKGGGGNLNLVTEYKNSGKHDLEEIKSYKSILKAIPLYASMNYDEQMKAFQLPESSNVRHVIISTNVAETSITIPNIRYVIDTGKEKRREYINNSESSYFAVRWISKASANQRAGRAGRIGPGHCYRLYSSPVYENLFEKFPPINILSIPLDSVLLYMHSLGIPNIYNFPFPSPPKEEHIEKSYNLLNILGAIKQDNKSKVVKLTSQGVSLSYFPLLPRFGKILLLVIAHIRVNLSNCNYIDDIQIQNLIYLLQYICIVVSCLSIGDIQNNEQLFNKNIMESQNIDKKESFLDIPLNYTNDIERLLWYSIGYLQIYQKFKNKGKIVQMIKLQEYCQYYQLNNRAMNEMRLMSRQIFSISINRYLINILKFNNENLLFSIKKSDWLLPFPNPEHRKIIRICYISGFIDHIAVRDDTNRLFKDGYKITSTTVSDSIISNIHPISTIKKMKPKYLVYNQVLISTDFTKQYLCDCIMISPDDILKSTTLDHTLIDCSNLLTLPNPFYNQEKDQIIGFAIPKYQLNGIIINLPTSEISLNSSGILASEIFLKALIDGLVFTKLEKYRSFINYSSTNFSKLFNKLVNFLFKYNIDSKESLINRWKSDGTFILDLFLSLYNIKAHNTLRLEWPPI
ncbi:DEAH box RNA helicase DHR1, putative [Cryptosporidium muris RN66]|uniref:RNA helicase n=1 Tax=Cryptosporidium muris (strain RN66) TaxID=441375 RepID=B6AAC0_CRYMR|nr:DEAH box RNA helicase DHR1, putative [Cryptosporidium muris RN66]EEA05161.1 DEAH box RNA helicase DHR1, putative [Cryptosporidium muris RN66]|eukprot:XP_002139510.1 DEAH box RNA helicase DHR1 [Cryptosporidium muris RN66]